MPLNKIVVCLLVVLFVASGEMKSQLTGSKTIGTNTFDGEFDYQTIRDAVNDLKSEGIAGSVQFEINSGIYDGGFTIGSIARVSESDSILFTSESGDSTDVVIKNNSDSDVNYLVSLNDCKRVTFKSITFESSDVSLSNQIILTEGSSNNKFENCVFHAKIESYCEGDDAMIVIHDKPSEEKQEFNNFINNKIIGGCIGISLEGVTGKLEDLESGNDIISNEFTNQNYKAVEVMNNRESFFNHNIVRYEGDSTAVTLKVDQVYDVQGNSIYSDGNIALFIDTFNANIPGLIGFDGLSVFNNAISCPDGVALKGNNIKGLFLGHNTLFNKSAENYTMKIDSVINMLSVFNLLVNKANYGVFDLTTSAKQHSNPFFRKFGSNFNGVYSGDFIGRLNDTAYATIDTWRKNHLGPDPNSSFGNIEFNDDPIGLELICGTSPSMRIKKEKLDDDGTVMMDLLAEYAFFKIEDVNGKTRNDSDFWKGQAEVDVKINIKGYITDSVLGDTLKSGEVQIFAKRKNKNMLELIANLEIESTGHYVVDNLSYRDYYWLKIIPDHPHYVPSYHTKESRWDSGDKTPLAEFCDDTLTYNIFPKKLEPRPSGEFTISGNISQTVETIGLTKMLGQDPIPGLDVILDITPPRPPTSVAITQTDSLGNYTFSNLPASNDGETYVVIVDHYGLPKDTLYEITLEGNIVNLNYCVDTTVQIEGCAPMVGAEDFQFMDILLYPNPMGETLKISGVGGKFHLSILDAHGRQILNLVNQNENTFISTVDFKSGLYFVVIKTSDGESMHKIIK